MNTYSWSDLYVGMTESFEVIVDNDKLQAFKEITGDNNPMHNELAFAKEKGFPGVVVYGLLTSSFLSTLAGVYLPGRNSLIQEVNVKYVRPVLVNDKLIIRGTVCDMNDTVKQIVLKISIESDQGQVVRGKMKVGVLDE